MKTEPIGSIPRPLALITAIAAFEAGRIDRESLNAEYARALQDTMDRFAETGSPCLRPNQLVFIGVIDPIDPKIETAELIRDRALEAASILPLEQLGTTDDCGFSPFADDTSTARETAFSKICGRVEGTAMAAEELGLSRAKLPA